MTIDEAPKLLESLAQELDIPQRANMRYAVKLGIEALELTIEMRKWRIINPAHLLPSETKE